MSFLVTAKLALTLAMSLTKYFSNRQLLMAGEARQAVQQMETAFETLQQVERIHKRLRTDPEYARRMRDEFRRD